MTTFVSVVHYFGLLYNVYVMHIGTRDVITSREVMLQNVMFIPFSFLGMAQVPQHGFGLRLA